MFKGLILGLTALVVVLIGASATSLNRPYDCSSVGKIEPISSYEEGKCAPLVNADEDAWEKYRKSMKLETRLDVVESCTCNLLHHELAWKSMITHEINTIYLASHRLVDKVVGEKQKKLQEENTNVPTKELLAELGDDDGHIFYWDNLSNILVEVVDNNKAATKIAEQFMAHYAEVYYDPETYTKPYNSASMAMQKQVSQTCSKHVENFDGFLFYFDRLKALSANDRFVLEVVGYNFDLYRLFTVMKLCNFLDMTGFIGWRMD